MYLGAKNENLATIAEIATFYKISENHLMKVVHQLGSHGYIETVRGKGGGMRLKHLPKKINIGDVIRSMETDLALVECMKKGSKCQIHSACTLKGILNEALEGMFLILNKYTLEDIIVKPNNLIRFLGGKKEKVPKA